MLDMSEYFIEPKPRTAYMRDAVAQYFGRLGFTCSAAERFCPHRNAAAVATSRTLDIVLNNRTTTTATELQRGMSALKGTEIEGPTLRPTTLPLCLHTSRALRFPVIPSALRFFSFLRYAFLEGFFKISFLLKVSRFFAIGPVGFCHSGHRMRYAAARCTALRIDQHGFDAVYMQTWERERRRYWRHTRTKAAVPAS